MDSMQFHDENEVAQKAILFPLVYNNHPNAHLRANQSIA